MKRADGHKKNRAMTHYSGLAGKYLLQQRNRSLLTIAAVVMSVALITAAGVFAQSIRELGVENIRARFGSFHAQVENVSGDKIDRLRRHAVIDSLGTTIPVGTIRLTEDLRAVVHAPDMAWLENTNHAVMEGTFPSAAGEIAVERWLLDAAGMSVAVGDQITVTMLLADTTEPTAEPRSGQAEKTFRVVGFIAPDAAGISEGTAAALVSQEEAQSVLGELATYRVGFTVAEGVEIQDGIASVAQAIGLSSGDINQNTALLTAIGASRMERNNDALRTVEIIVAAVLVVATVAVIYNSFMISVVERIRQFGMLRTVGATPRQIRRLVFRQAGITAAIGAPLGTAAGLLAVRIVVAVFNGFSTDIGFAGVGMTYPPLVLVGGPALGVLSVYLSAFLPARSAGRVSPLEALQAHGRFVRDRVNSRKSPLLRRLFGVSGRLASQNLRRHPGRFLVTAFSIGIGVVLFITFAEFFNILSDASANTYSNVLRGDVTVANVGNRHGGINDADKERIDRLPGVAGTTGLYEVAGYAVLPAASVTDVNDGVEPDVAEKARRVTGMDGPVFELSILGLDEEALESIRSRVITGFGSLREPATSAGAYVRAGVLEMGDTVRLMVDNRLVTLPVVGLADSLPEGNYNRTTIVTHIDTARDIAGTDGYTGFELELGDGARSSDVVRAVKAVTGNRPYLRVYDMSTVERYGEQIGLQMSILLYGLVAVVSLIGALNIVNTMTTNLIIRVKEFGTLRAVGMTVTQMRLMVSIEAVLYGLWAVVGGGAVGVSLVRLVFVNVAEVQAIPWEFPWLSLAVSAVAAVGLCLLSTAVPMRRIAAMNIVESIRTVE